MTAEPRITVTVEKEVDPETARVLYALYTTAFGHLEATAAARHLLHEQEFLDEMANPRILKYIAWDRERAPVGLCTVTDSLDEVPWISPAFYAEQYPEQYARGAIHYLGVMMVHPDRQHVGAFRLLCERIMLAALRVRAVVAWDVCEHNWTAGVQRLFSGILAQMTTGTVAEIDRQIYFGAKIEGASPAYWKDRLIEDEDLMS